MRMREASPAASENEFDISNALFGGSDIESDDESNGRFHENKDRVARRETGDVLGYESEESDDDAFIAGQQQIANRKTSNVKGRWSRKVVGFKQWA